MKKWPVLLCSCGGKPEQEGHLYCWPGVIKIISKLPQGASGRWFRCRLCSAWKRTKRPASLPMHHFRRKRLCLWADITLNCSPQHRTFFLHRGHPYLARRGHSQVRDEGHAGPLKWTWQFRPGSKAEGQSVSPQGTRKPCHAASQKWAFVQEVQGMQGADLTVRSFVGRCTSRKGKLQRFSLNAFSKIFSKLVSSSSSGSNNEGWRLLLHSLKQSMLYLGVSQW